MARPSIDYLRSRLFCSPTLGILTWANGRRKGKRAGYECTGARRLKILGRLYPEHRVIWALYYGEWPDDNLMIDHIDRNPYNNNINNLRLATNSQNQMNTPSKNYSFCKQTGRWRVAIWAENVHIHIGRFEDEEVAKEKAQEARMKYHGEFSYR